MSAKDQAMQAARGFEQLAHRHKMLKESLDEAAEEVARAFKKAGIPFLDWTDEEGIYHIVSVDLKESVKHKASRKKRRRRDELPLEEASN